MGIVESEFYFITFKFGCLGRGTIYFTFFTICYIQNFKNVISIVMYLVLKTAFVISKTSKFHVNSIKQPLNPLTRFDLDYLSLVVKLRALLWSNTGITVL